jgi:hypothetical protein
MKKTIFLFSIIITLFIAGCNEKNLLNQINGTWHLQKYAVGGVDETRQFDSMYTGFRWTFSGSTFNQSWTSVKLYTLYTLDTITHLDTTTHALVIDSVTTTTAVVPTGIFDQAKGDWYLTNGNYYLVTRDSTYGNNEYQIIDHSKSSLHLLNGNKDYYLAK